MAFFSDQRPKLAIGCEKSGNAARCFSLAPPPLRCERESERANKERVLRARVFGVCVGRSARALRARQLALLNKSLVA